MGLGTTVDIQKLRRRLDWGYKRAHDSVNYRMRTAAGGRLAGWCRPTWISLLLTERCNARCVHCDIWKNRGKEDDAPTAAEWCAALSDIRSWLGPVHVCVTGGEALLRQHTVDVVAHGSRIGLFVEVLTHGYWKDQTRVEALARARPWRVTMSLDGIGAAHDTVRGRPGFFEAAVRSLDTLERLRREEDLGFSIRLKTVIMEHNLNDLASIARFATREKMDVLFQPVEQNYNSDEDADWYKDSRNWPQDPARAVAAVEELRRMRSEGWAIANTDAQLEAMIPYFRDPARWQVVTRDHTAHEEAPVCSALGLLQIQANGDVTACYAAPSIGNIRRARPQDIWRGRPKWWEKGCCHERRLNAQPSA